jgi:lysine 2,3-aminomutase
MDRVSNITLKNKEMSTPVMPRQGWKEILAESIVSVEQLQSLFHLDRAALETVTSFYPMRINPYYLSLIQEKNDAIWKQAVPDMREIESDLFSADPLAEEIQSPAPNLIHRYPDRVLFMVSNQCAMFCRYCMRKRKTGSPQQVGAQAIEKGLNYIGKNKNVRDVILSGGDPLLLEDDAIEWILAHLRAIPHVEIIRIHSRTPCTLPQRITEDLVKILKKFHPVYVNTHFNHPVEITDIAAHACALLADSGIPLGCQTVLLKGINDNPEVMADLMRKLVKIRIRPYYIHHADPVKGTAHFRTSLQTGLAIMKALRAHTSGLSMPAYMIDLPGGGGKVPLQERCDHAGSSVCFNQSTRSRDALYGGPFL